MYIQNIAVYISNIINKSWQYFISMQYIQRSSIIIAISLSLSCFLAFFWIFFLIFLLPLGISLEHGSSNESTTSDDHIFPLFSPFSIFHFSWIGQWEIERRRETEIERDRDAPADLHSHQWCERPAGGEQGLEIESLLTWSLHMMTWVFSCVHHCPIPMIVISNKICNDHRIWAHLGFLVVTDLQASLTQWLWLAAFIQKWRKNWSSSSRQTKM